MLFIKRLFGNVRTRIWAIVSLVMAALMIVVSVLASTTFYEVICMALGGERTFGRGEGRYYEVAATDKEDAFRRGNAFNEEICEEGFVLLKNDGAALPLSSDEKKVSVFGKNSVELVYGGTGSGGGNYDGAATLSQSLKSAGFEVNPTLEAFYLDDKKSGEGRTPNPKIENSGDVTLSTGETPQDKYTQEVKASYAQYADAAVVVFSRIGGEGFDLPRTMEDTSKHYLELDVNEIALLEAVKDGPFRKVIVLLNASTTMEIGALKDDPEIDACISIGGPGYSGINALGRLLCGDVTFSGKTVDTWARDFTKDPTWYNFGNNFTDDGARYYTLDEDGERKYERYYFVDYEEGIYLGYRYYETRGEGDEEWYGANVVYPFGYGLSYTQFGWEILEPEKLSGLAITDENKNTPVEIDVRVTNTGAYAGKDVVQLYFEAPAGKIEKPAETLAAFAKTPLLYPTAENAADPAFAADGEDKPNSAVVTLVFLPYYAASYDYSNANENDFYGYELEGGEYRLALKTDAHTYKEGIDPVSLAVGEDGVRFAEDPVTGNAVENRYEDASEELDTVLSRSDWDKTWPTTPDGHDLAEYGFDKADLTSMKHNNPAPETGEVKTDQKVKLKAVELRGLAYNDKKWDTLLDSLSFREMRDLFNKGAFKTMGITRIGLPETIASDGPVGFANFVSSANVYGTVSYASEYTIGSTWSEEIAERFGATVGEEGNFGKQNVDPYVPYSGWYAPGMNLHRSPFGGRNFEYFSEDPFLTGKLAAAQIRGAESKGVVTYMKHFALNEQETHRDDNGLCTWATEQSIRELYLRPFEIAVKEASPKGIMSSFNRIGTRWTGGDYRLLTEILRGEWGFVGTVICDFNVSSYMNTEQMIYAGGDLNLTTTRPWMTADETDAADRNVLRRAAHNILYSVVNSNAMNGVTPDTVFRVAMPLWQMFLFIGDAVLAAVFATWGFFEIRRLVREQKKKKKEA